MCALLHTDLQLLVPIDFQLLVWFSQLNRTMTALIQMVIGFQLFRYWESKFLNKVLKDTCSHSHWVVYEKRKEKKSLKLKKGNLRYNKMLIWPMADESSAS